MFRLSKAVVLAAIVVLTILAGSAIAIEFIGECDDCCGASACDDCISCWCCSAVPATLEPADAPGSVQLEAEPIAIPAHQFVESHELELLDPPPRS